MGRIPSPVRGWNLGVDDPAAHAEPAAVWRGGDHPYRRAEPPHQHGEVAPGLTPGTEVGVHERCCGHVHAAADTTLRPMARAESIVLVNTGNGKGKSSAAFGVMGRAWARGWNVAVVQFIKSGRWKTGEEKLAAHLG